MWSQLNSLEYRYVFSYKLVIDHQGPNLESYYRRAVSSDSSHYPQEVVVAQFSHSYFMQYDIQTFQSGVVLVKKKAEYRSSYTAAPCVPIYVDILVSLVYKTAYSTSIA